MVVIILQALKLRYVDVNIESICSQFIFPPFRIRLYWWWNAHILAAEKELVTVYKSRSAIFIFYSVLNFQFNFHGRSSQWIGLVKPWPGQVKIFQPVIITLSVLEENRDYTIEDICLYTLKEGVTSCASFSTTSQKDFKW